jgi:hypothetical protein
MLEDMIRGAQRVLMAGGICVIDIADAIYWKSETWHGANAIKAMGHVVGLRRCSEIAYWSKDANQLARGHSDKQWLIIFQKKQQERPSLTVSSKSRHLNYLKPTYRFGLFGADEADWPLSLVSDLLQTFRLSELDCVVDPFFGSGLIARECIRRGTKRFIGYEISQERSADFHQENAEITSLRQK